jgi:MerR family copper efflux transcriptional regulator
VTTYLIAEVAERTGFSPPTLRYYEEIGLLPAAERGDNGYRVYDDATLERLGFVKRAKRLGCSLDEITELTRAWEAGRCGPVQQRLRALIDAKLVEVVARIAELAVLAADLRRAAVGLTVHTPDGPCDDRCGCSGTPEPVTEPAPVALSSNPATPGLGDAKEPIACTLGAGDMSGRLDEWDALLADRRDLLSGVIARVPLDEGIRLEFGANSDVTEIARLAAAEQECCRFFRFALVIDQRGTALEVRAPADGQAVLNALFGAG